eukprot:m.18633 g.18633  ORF g.18633 m.18633 type:complete len:551 (+) comp11532_c0_seq2:122-1774(+)
MSKQQGRLGCDIANGGGVTKEMTSLSMFTNPIRARGGDAAHNGASANERTKLLGDQDDSTSEDGALAAREVIQGYRRRLPKYLRRSHRTLRLQVFLLALFDLSLCYIFWFLTAETDDKRPPSARQQVENYSFQSSIVDVVGVSMLRFLIVSIAYAGIGTVVSWPVVLCTAGTSVFLIVKIYFYASKFTAVMDYAVFISSFALCWMEAVFHAARIAPLEKQFRHLRQAAASADGCASPGAYAGRTDPQSGATSPGLGQSSNAVFFTPGGSDVDSDGYGTPGSSPGERPLSSNTYASPEQLQDALKAVADARRAGMFDGEAGLTEHDSDERKATLSRLGLQAVQQTWRLAADDTQGSWTVEADRGGVRITSRMVENRHVLRSEGIIRVSPSVLFHVLHGNVDAQSAWNPIVDRYEVVETIDRHTDVTYSVAAAQAGGLISPRDFVCVRQWVKRDGNMVIAETSIEHPDRPTADGQIRGLMGPGGYVLMTVPGQPHVTNLIWVFNADLKGWLPRYLVHQTMCNLLVTHHEGVRSLLQSPSSSAAENPKEELYV